MCSAGRRNYLVRWFRQALRESGTGGKVIIADADRYAAASAEGDLTIELPSIADPNYSKALLETCANENVTLLISLNDFELAKWSEINLAEYRSLGATVVTLERETQTKVEDKYECAKLVSAVGLRAPVTMLASDVIDSVVEPHTLGTEVVVKHRFGSGSVGLTRCSAPDLKLVIERSLEDVRDRWGGRILDRRLAAESVVVQQCIHGKEFGLDIVNDLERRYVTTLARRKISMRSGETDQAVTSDPKSFATLGRTLSAALQHQGVLDMDVITDPVGRTWIIDANPRFGGGYPFSHIAGADLPSCYVAWNLRRSIDPQWLEPKIGIVGSKFQDIARVACNPETTHAPA